MAEPSGKQTINIQALLQRGADAQGAGRRQEALAIFRRVLTLQPRNVLALNGMGSLLGQLGHHLDALEYLDRAIAVAPNQVQLRFNRGFALQKAGRLQPALDEYDRALAIEPTNLLCLENRASALRALDRPKEAFQAIDACIAIDRENARFHLRRGDILSDLESHDDAAAAFEKALALGPNDPNTLNSCAAMAMNSGDDAKGMALLERALAVDPEFGPAHVHIGFVRLRAGDYERGWPEYEWRRSGSKSKERRLLRSPLWLGEEDLKAKSILVYAEQAFGDTIQFCRYLAPLSERGPRICFEPQKELSQLLSSLKGNHQLIPKGESIPRTDFHCPLLSLPYALGTRVGTIPAQTPYLSVPTATIERWRRRLGLLGHNNTDRLVGISWRGRPNGEGRETGRSVPLSLFRALSEIPGIRLVSLQKWLGVDQLKTLPVDMAVETIGDFDMEPDGAFVDSAAIMHSVDLVITIDTALAHLAGALARPVWVALKYAADWRWLEGSTTPWYPSMRLFRQKSRGDWHSVFDEMAQTLRNEVSEGAPSALQTTRV